MYGRLGLCWSAQTCPLKLLFSYKSSVQAVDEGTVMTDCCLPSTTPSRTTCTTNNQLQIVLHLSCQYGLSPPHLAAILPTVIVRLNIRVRHPPQPLSRTTVLILHAAVIRVRLLEDDGSNENDENCPLPTPCTNNPRRAIFTMVSFSTKWSSRDYRENRESIHIDSRILV